MAGTRDSPGCNRPQRPPPLDCPASRQIARNRGVLSVTSNARPLRRSSRKCVVTRIEVHCSPGASCPCQTLAARRLLSSTVAWGTSCTCCTSGRLNTYKQFLLPLPDVGRRTPLEFHCSLGNLLHLLHVWPIEYLQAVLGRSGLIWASLRCSDFLGCWVFRNLSRCIFVTTIPIIDAF